MINDALQKIVIVGGGTAGWMTASALAKIVGTQHCAIELVESDHIGTVGVGEATLPHLRAFIQRLGIDESTFMRTTNATYKTGIEFSNWGDKGEAYIHPFGDYGEPIGGIDFHHYWLRLRELGDLTPICDYSLPVKASQASKFDYPSADTSTLASTFGYAYHLDASAFAKYLRTYCEKLGVVRTEGKVEHVTTCEQSGNIASVTLEGGRSIEGDLFIDCSGFRGLLIEQTLKSGYQDWSHCLPCDRAVAIPCQSNGDITPYTRAIAHDAGWRWRIPLQHRTGNGVIYCSKYMQPDEAEQLLRDNLEGEPLGNANHIQFTTGRRNQFWSKNCIAIGLSAGFLEPLESTSIHLIQLAIMKLVEFFPYKNIDSTLRDEYNRDMGLEFETLRDFLVLHYTATRREDSPFWQYCKNMEKPAALAHKMALFEQTGRVSPYTEGLFLKPSWVAVYLGQGVVPKSYDTRVEQLDLEKLANHFMGIKQAVAQTVQAMPNHTDSITKYCMAKEGEYVAPVGSTNLYGQTP